jgi:hypothetical protein
MKYWGITAVVCCLGLVLACHTPTKATSGTPTLALVSPLQLGGRDYRTINATDVPKLRQLNVGRESLTLTNSDTHHSVTVRTVAEYEKQTAKGYFPFSTADILDAWQFDKASCVLKAAAKAHQVQTSFISQPKHGVQSLELLPVDVLPSHESDDEAEHKRRTAMDASIAQLVKEGIVVADTSEKHKITLQWSGKLFTKEALIKMYGTNVIREMPGSVLTLIELARGDFTGDGIEDILVYDIHRFTEGSFVSYHVYLLTRTDAKGLFRIKEL